MDYTTKQWEIGLSGLGCPHTLWDTRFTGLNQASYTELLPVTVSMIRMMEDTSIFIHIISTGKIGPVYQYRAMTVIPMRPCRVGRTPGGRDWGYLFPFGIGALVTGVQHAG